MVKIGLEIHGYLDTREKLFCDCESVHGAKQVSPNVNICPVCTGQPGSKPMLPNSSAVDRVIQIALILGCKVSEKLVWQRKHYNWPDMPKGFQSTISGPHAVANGEKGKFMGIGITECHLEEDPASWNPKTGEIDYNRSGSPLIEIVTEPDFKDSEEVVLWLRQLITTLGYVKAIDKSAGIKADVNVSVDKGQRIEVKNVNSLRNIKAVIDFEILRQNKDLPKIQETRRFDEIKGVTQLMRTKEKASDYRFISEPDLPVMVIDKKRIERIKKGLPETPYEKLSKLIKKHKIEKYHAEILTKKLEVVEFFEKVVEKSNVKLAVRWVTEELMRALNYARKELDEVNVDPYHFVELLDLVESGAMTELKAKDILNEFLPVSFSPKKKLKEHSKISSDVEIGKFIKDVIENNVKAVKDFKLGKKESLNFLIGQVMRLSDKRADFKKVRELLVQELG
ncbi:MAG: Asp-tRNA(Asn)/Glu-tRNA(Gln) amidotransferase subunit GatB [Candidatus Pacearchaeota archaeon]|nr:Asp-tRNA(Asn)/Glu-tRNA(Gln) amidotransferase subunit GatB [Candidatus Pacearchaeota archaeon]